MTVDAESSSGCTRRSSRRLSGLGPASNRAPNTIGLCPPQRGGGSCGASPAPRRSSTRAARAARAAGDSHPEVPPRLGRLDAVRCNGTSRGATPADTLPGSRARRQVARDTLPTRSSDANAAHHLRLRTSPQGPPVGTAQRRAPKILVCLRFGLETLRLGLGVPPRRSPAGGDPGLGIAPRLTEGSVCQADRPRAALTRQPGVAEAGRRLATRQAPIGLRRRAGDRSPGMAWRALARRRAHGPGPTGREALLPWTDPAATAWPGRRYREPRKGACRAGRLSS